MTTTTASRRSGASFAVTDVRAVLADRVLDDATVVVEHGVIVEVATGVAAPPGAVDGRGLFCLPGLVDTHSDGLEKELRPRPSVELPMDFALRSFEGRVRAAGVTTMFHGVGFEDGEKYHRSVEQAAAMCDSIARRSNDDDALLDHRVLHRLDARDADGLGALAHELAMRHSGASRLATLPLVSYEDHTPGQGQYTDRTYYERYVAGTKGFDADEARRYIDGVQADRDLLLGNKDTALAWLAERARAGVLRLMCHDPATPGEVDDAVDREAAIAEFPTTVHAARRARERGLRIVSGAPNVLRGGSHSGNVSAAELISLGLCDAIASDYLPSTLIGAVARLVDQGITDLPTAVGLVTAGPADMVGLTDRGRLAVGQRGDLALVAFDGALPTIHVVHAVHDVVVPRTLERSVGVAVSGVAG